jgi:hypothetical protein
MANLVLCKTVVLPCLTFCFLVDFAQGHQYRYGFATGATIHIYSAYVRANGMVVQTQVCANSLHEAINLLKGMYGSDNLIHMPQLVQ